MAKIYVDLSGRMGHLTKWQGDIGAAAATPNLRYVGKDGQTAGGYYNPVRSYGYMSPTPNTFTTVGESDGTYNFTDRWRASIFDSVTGSFYFGEDGNGLVWGGDFSSSGSTTATNLREAFASSIAGTLVHITDFEIYQKNGARQIFCSYTNSAGLGGNIMTFVPAADGSISADDFTWLSATASGGFNTGATNDVFMRNADNGYMYIFDGNAVHKVDGTTAGGAGGTVTANVLTFPFAFTLTDALDWRGKMWICTQTSSSLSTQINNNAYNENIVGVYVWDRQSTIIGAEDFVPMTGVREIRKLYVTDTGVLRAIVVSSAGFTQVRTYNGATFEVVAEAGAGAFPTFKDSFTTMGGLAVWLGYDRTFYAYGKIAPGETDALYTLGDVSAELTGTYSPGAILYAYGPSAIGPTTPVQAIFWSGFDGGSSAVKNRIWFPFQDGSNGHAGNVYTMVKTLPKLSTVNYINIFCKPATASPSTIGTVGIYLNQSTSSFKDYAVTGDLANRGYITIPIRKPYVNAFQFKFVWPTNTSLGSTDFAPAYAEIDYTPTEPFK